MNPVYFVACVIVAALFVYLFVALLKPEIFE
jgi:K+-transporting ATPase KdpF subunit